MPLQPEDLRPLPVWVVMPILANPALTRTAIASVLAQTVPIRLLLVNQGVDDDFRDELEKIAEEYSDHVLLWSHQPPLPSLAATWNHALAVAWTSGAEYALVVNNDVELHRSTVEYLREALIQTGALFVSAIGVTADDFARVRDRVPDPLGLPAQHGGPDFSCFLISRECHLRFQFDEHFTPAFCEDLDYHRRLMLAGEGERIFSVNLPYLHHSSQTLKSVDPRERMRIEKAIESGSRAYYKRKWGGPVNAERFALPFRPDTAAELITTPDLQRYVADHGAGLPDVDVMYLGMQGNYQPPPVTREEQSSGQAS
jgi:GT2 family glycosyltransferase